MNVVWARSRFSNLLLAEYNFALSYFGVVRSSHMPTFVSVEPAGICQLHCPECPVGMGNPRPDREPYMSMPLFERVLGQVAPYVHTMQFYFQGEPLLHARLPEMIRQAHEAGLYTILSTNAQALTPALAREVIAAGLSRIIVSIDGFTQQSYEAYRVGGNLQKALDGLRYLREAKQQLRARRTCIVLQVLRLRSNEQEWAWIRRHYRELGADRLEMKTAQLYDYEHGHPLMTTDERYSRYRLGKDGLYHPKNQPSDKRRFVPCHRLWTGCVITTDGRVLPCCFDKAASYAYGNLADCTLEELYHSERADCLRKAVLMGKNSVQMCRNCTR